jgi:iron complex outermembrane recepter protein
LDNNNHTLPGVTISLNDGSFGTVSDQDGAFVFHELPVRPYNLAASFIGYETFITTLETESGEFQITIKMAARDYELDVVHIINNRRENLRRSESTSVEMVGGSFLTANRSGSLMQTLQAVPGVHSMSIGSGVSKPVIRGLGYYRVVFARNWIRQSGQLWSSHTGLSVDQHNLIVSVSFLLKKSSNFV